MSSRSKQSREERQADMRARHAKPEDAFTARPSSYKEVHHSPAWWAELWDFDPSIVRSLALQETEGVLRRVSKATATKRRKVTQKIADSAATVPLNRFTTSFKR